MSQESIFLFALLVLGIVCKNNSVTIAAAILLCVRVTSFAPAVLPWIKEHGINLGVIVITVAVLAPIATGDVRLQDAYELLFHTKGWIVLLSGLAVAVLGGMGLEFLKTGPQMTAGLIIGTIIGVVAFKGLPVGPLIGGGIAVVFIRIFEYFSLL